jgi:hypothetical protein
MKFKGTPFYLFILLVLLSACGQDDEATLPPPPTESISSQSTPEALDTAKPVPTVIVIRAEVNEPAATVTIAPPSTVTPLPTSTPVKVDLRTAEDFGTTYNPLTGELIGDEITLNRRPLAVKISNAPPKWVRPQSGLIEADLIFEHVTEAGITRFTILIYGKSPPKVGPIRSARLIDLELPAMYDAALVYSGSSEGVREKLLESDFRSRILFAFESGYYRSGEAKPLEHTLYALPNELWETLEAKGLNQRPVFNTFTAFNSDPPANGQPATDVTIDYDWTLINWVFDPESGRYQRWIDGEPHLDQNSGDQVNTANVIVVFADHVQDPDICEQLINGICTAYSVEINLLGSGPAIIFRDGMRYDGIWTRNNRYDMLTFYDNDGEPLPLQVGNSWIQIIPNWYENPVIVAR